MNRVSPISASTSPAGLTLVEVLMSMLVTGIGLLSVIVLLPLSFVRAVQATNLTNGTILRYNAESLFEADPTDLVYVYPFWEPSTTYTPGQFVLAPTNSVGNNHYFKAVPPTPAGGGLSGALAPTWVLTGGTTPDGGVTWQDQGLLDHYIVDPLGAFSIGNTLGINPPPALVAALPMTRQMINRYGAAANGNGGPLPSLTAASRLTMLPDSWAEQARGPVTGFTITTATLTGPDLSGVGFSPPDTANNVSLTSRIVLIDASGKNSQTRIITSIANPTVTWAATDPLPATFVPVQARVETQEQRYTWMLTVRRSTNGQADIDVTVFFRRPVVAGSPDEQLYLASGAGSQFTVQYGGLPKPFAKKGGFLFDTSYARWYRIIDITNDNGTQFTVTVDNQRPTTESSPPGTTDFGAVFMRGVVDVFPIGNE